MKSILVVSHDLFIKYISQIKMSQRIKTRSRMFYESELEEYYMDIIIKTTIYYIERRQNGNENN